MGGWTPMRDPEGITPKLFWKAGTVFGFKNGIADLIKEGVQKLYNTKCVSIMIQKFIMATKSIIWFIIFLYSTNYDTMSDWEFLMSVLNLISLSPYGEL